VIAGIVWLVRIAASNRQQPADKGPASEMPLDVLKRRYASGEINKEQFEEMKRTLS
jgi:putative membrane protein